MIFRFMMFLERLEYDKYDFQHLQGAVRCVYGHKKSMVSYYSNPSNLPKPPQIQKCRTIFRVPNFRGLVLEAQRELDKKFGHF